MSTLSRSVSRLFNNNRKVISLDSCNLATKSSAKYGQNKRTAYLYATGTATVLGICIGMKLKNSEFLRNHDITFPKILPEVLAERPYTRKVVSLLNRLSFNSID